MPDTLVPPEQKPETESDRIKRAHLTGLFDFANPEAIKQRVREVKGNPDLVYNVHQRYYKTGCFQAIAKSPIFENLTLGIICVNAIWISIDTDYNSADHLGKADFIFVLADSMFFAYFSVELFIRFGAFQKKCDCFRDAWFVFDSTLVALYLFDPFIITILAMAQGGEGMDLPTSILRLFRLARLSRLVKMLRSLPELMIMIKGITSATGAVGYSLILLMLFTYVFSIALVQLSGDTEMGYEFFKTVPLGMWSLVIFATFLDDLSYFGDRVKAESTPCLIIVTIFIVIASMTVMNMLIGVLCEVISSTANEERESMMTDKVHEKFGDIVKNIDLKAGDNNGKLSWNEFQQIMELPTAVEALESVDVDPIGMIDFAEEFFFDDDGVPQELTFDQFMEMVLDLRGGQEASLKDVMHLGKRFNKKFMVLKNKCEKISDKLGQLLGDAPVGKRGTFVASKSTSLGGTTSDTSAFG